MQFLFKNYMHILTRTQGKKFKVMFFVKIGSKGISLTLNRPGGGESGLKLVFLSAVLKR